MRAAFLFNVAVAFVAAFSPLCCVAAEDDTVSRQAVLATAKDYLGQKDKYYKIYMPLLENGSAQSSCIRRMEYYAGKLGPYLEWLGDELVLMGEMSSASDKQAVAFSLHVSAGNLDSELKSLRTVIDMDKKNCLNDVTANGEFDKFDKWSSDMGEMLGRITELTNALTAARP